MNDVTRGSSGVAETHLESTVTGQLNCKYLASVFSWCPLSMAPPLPWKTTNMRRHSVHAGPQACWETWWIWTMLSSRDRAGTEKIRPWPSHLKSGKAKATQRNLIKSTKSEYGWKSLNVSCSISSLFSATSTFKEFQHQDVYRDWLLQALRQMQFQFIGQNIL